MHETCLGSMTDPPASAAEFERLAILPEGPSQLGAPANYLLCVHFLCGLPIHICSPFREPGNPLRSVALAHSLSPRRSSIEFASHRRASNSGNAASFAAICVNLLLLRPRPANLALTTTADNGQLFQRAGGDVEG